MSRERIADFDLGKFWQSSIQRAAAARLIAAHDSDVDFDPSEAFTASLLQDLGVLGLLMRRPEFAKDWNKLSSLDPAPRRAKELDLLGQTHDELAAELNNLPEGFAVHRQVQKILQDRQKMADGELPANWGFGEVMDRSFTILARG